MEFSVGILYSTVELLNIIKTNPIQNTDLKKLFKTINVASTEEILRVSQVVNWIELQPDGSLEITEKGNELLNCKTQLELLRIQLKHIIVLTRPPWSNVICNGRLEAQKYFDDEILQCFEEAELFYGYSKDVISWWDFVASNVRSNKNENKLEIGREGEKRSFEYESKRTGIKPIWQSIESNFSGFDILSRVSKSNFEKYLIEVKSTNQKIRDSKIFISRNEWQTSKKTNKYVYHLWSLLDKPTLYVVDSMVVDKHVPGNRGLGIWENVSISFGKLIKDQKPIRV